MGQAFRYAGLTRFFKGNTHVHTTNSDGGWSPEEAIARYRDRGYDFLAVTDHNVVTRLADRSSDAFCLIDSVEINDQPTDWRTRHVVCVGVSETADFPERGDFETMQSAAVEQGAVLCLCHPHWSGNSIEQIAAGPYHGVEVFNGVCFYLNDKASGAAAWDELLTRGRDLFGFAADDNHGRPPGLPQHDLGWVQVAAERLDREAILAALRAGKFYSSTGPEIRELICDGEKLTVRCSPAQHIWLIGPAWVQERINRPAGQAVEEHTFDLTRIRASGELPFIRLEIADERGRRAWTNKLFV